MGPAGEPAGFLAIPQGCLGSALAIWANMTTPLIMSMIQDFTILQTTVIPGDPSFRSVGRDVLDRHIEDARQAARANSKDDFLLSLMRLLALPQNGHTRLIPNDVISVVPMRFVTIGTEVAWSTRRLRSLRRLAVNWFPSTAFP